MSAENLQNTDKIDHFGSLLTGSHVYGLRHRAIVLWSIAAVQPNTADSYLDKIFEDG